MRFFVVYMPEFKRWATVVLNGQRQIGFLALHLDSSLEKVKERTVDLACDHVLGEVEFDRMEAENPQNLMDLSGAYELRMWDPETMNPALKWVGGRNPSVYLDTPPYHI